MYLFGVKYSYNLDRLQIACCHLVFGKKSPSFQNVDIFPELDRCTPCVFIGTVARFSRNKSLLISFGAPVGKLTTVIIHRPGVVTARSASMEITIDTLR